MGTKPSHRMNGGSHRNFLAKYHHRLSAINQFSTEATLRLETDNQNCSFGYRQVMPQVMHDSAAIAHSTSGHDHAWTINFIQRSRLTWSCTRTSRTQVAEQFTCLDHVQCFSVEQFVIFSVDLRGMNRHRTVEKDRKLWERLSHKGSSE